MSKIRFAVVGSGWRSLFYIRIARALPEIFELTTLLCRSQEKAGRFQKEYGISATVNEQDVIASAPDFIVSAVSEDSIAETAAKWCRYGFPVLSETPAGLSYEQLEMLWDLRQTSGARIQIAEQYQFYPRYDAIIRLIRSGLIGEAVSLDISAMHGCHAASMIRNFLDTGLEEVRLTGKAFSFPVTETRTRYEVLTEGKISLKEQHHVILEFESGKAAVYDFLSEQYRSPVRNRSIRLRGTRGELLNDMVYFLNEGNLPRQASLIFKYDPSGREVLSVTFQGQSLYSPPFGVCGLSEDETAIARVLSGMKEYVDTGREVYPLSCALEDAYLALLMTDSPLSRRGTETADESSGDRIETKSSSGWYQNETNPRPWKQPCRGRYTNQSKQEVHIE